MNESETIAFVIAETNQNELSQLEQELTDSGFSWLDFWENLNIIDNLILSIDNKMYST